MTKSTTVLPPKPNDSEENPFLAALETAVKNRNTFEGSRERIRAGEGATLTQAKNLPNTRAKKIQFQDDEALDYLLSWMKSHSSWAETSLGGDSELEALETIATLEDSWTIKWFNQGFYRHPVSAGFQPGKRYCFELSDEAFFRGPVQINEFAVNLRAWVTCFDDDIIAFETCVVPPVRD